MLRHLPPTAVPVQGSDVWHGLTALLRPESAVRGFRSAVLERAGNSACHLLTSGRVALTVILLGLKRLSDRSQVVLPAYTCPTVVQAVLKAGLEPVLCDVSVETLDLDRAMLSRLISDKVLAIVPAHLYGLAQDVRDLLAIGQEHNIFVIEDAAQAFGATLQGRMVGTWGDAGFYSLGRGKCIPAGHGGVIVCQDGCASAVSEVMKEAVGDGADWDFRSLALFSGYGLATRPMGWWFVARTPLNPAEESDMSELPAIHLRGLSPVQASLGASILTRLDTFQRTSRRNARRLMAQLADFDFITLPQVPPDADPVFLRLPIVVQGEERSKRLFSLLWQKGIGVSRSYGHTLPDLCSGVFPMSGRDFPGASRLAKCLLTLPTHAYLREEDFARIVDAFVVVNSEGG